MTKPTLVFVPGAWLGPEIYGQTMSILDQQGYPTVGLPLPSVDANPPHTSFDGDVEGIRSCVKKLVEEDSKDVILVAHSYSGMPAGEALHGLAKRDREAQGLPGGVRRLVFIQALAVPEGFSPRAGGQEFPAWMRVDHEKGVVNVTADDAKAVFYNDLSPEEGDKWVATLRPQSVGVYTSITTFAAWKYIPSTFVVGKQDKTAITPEVAKYMIDAARQQTPSAFDVIEECDGGHCLMLSHPKWLAEVMQRAAQ